MTERSKRKVGPGSGNRMQKPLFQPSPLEIERACEDIQRSWTKTERLARKGKNKNTPDWIVPMIYVPRSNFAYAPRSSLVGESTTVT